MFLTNLFKFKRKCKHEKVSLQKDFAYCPDCGQLVRNEWFITRCACCGVKLKSVTTKGEIYPQEHFCTNCGCSDYYIEKLENINFIDVHFATLKRTEVHESKDSSNTIQYWQEKTNAQPKLLIQFQ